MFSNDVISRENVLYKYCTNIQVLHEYFFPSIFFVFTDTFAWNDKQCKQMKISKTV